MGEKVTPARSCFFQRQNEMPVFGTLPAGSQTADSISSQTREVRLICTTPAAEKYYVSSLGNYRSAPIRCRHMPLLGCRPD